MAAWHEGIIARWSSTIDDSANDVSGNGHNGTYIGGMGTVADVSNGGKRAYEFDGTDDGLEAPLWDYDGTGDFPFSISLWVKSEDNSKGCQFIGNYNNSAYGMSISQYQGLLYLGMESTDGNGYASLRRSITSSFSSWTHIAMTYDGSGDVDEIKVYVNGTLATSSSGGLAVTGSYVKLGANSSPIQMGGRINPVYDTGGGSGGSGGGRGGTSFFKGRIEDVIIHDRVIDSTNVATIYDSGSGKGKLAPISIPNAGSGVGTGNQPSIHIGSTLQLTTGSGTGSGIAPVISARVTLNLPSGSGSGAGFSPSLSAGRNFILLAGSGKGTGNTPILSIGGVASILLPAGGGQGIGSAPVFSAGVSPLIVAGFSTGTGYVPTLSANVIVKRTSHNRSLLDFGTLFPQRLETWQ